MLKRKSKKSKKLQKRKKRNPDERQIYLTPGQVKTHLRSYLNTEMKRYSGSDPFMIYILRTIKNQIEQLNNTDDISGSIFGLQIVVDNLVEKTKQLIPPDAANEDVGYDFLYDT